MDKKIRRLLDLAHTFLPAFIEANKENLGDRKGIYLAIGTDYAMAENEIHGEAIGMLPEEKIEEKKAFASEKINRMRANKESCSFESENEEQKQYGGGIKALTLYVAPSGFPPHLDQKFALQLCMLAGEIKLPDVLDIVQISYTRTQYWKKVNGEATVLS